MRILAAGASIIAVAGATASAGAAPAARIGDATTRGSILPPGSPVVLICGKPAARAGDQVLSRSGPANAPLPAQIVSGSATVLIGGKPAARIGDTTANGDKILAGCPTVLIGG